VDSPQIYGYELYGLGYLMADKNSDNKYPCSYCGKVFAIPAQADACRDDHGLLYVALTKEELNHILQFFYTKEDDLIEPSLIKRLQRYARAKAI
jgi:hypothetical protein